MNRTLTLALLVFLLLTGCSEENPVQPASNEVAPLLEMKAAALPDVAITAFTANPVTVEPGDSLVLTANVGNLGATAAPPFSVRVWERISGKTLARKTLPGLPAGGSATGSVTLTVPAEAISASLEPGVYTLVCSHDVGDGNPDNDYRIDRVVLNTPGSSQTIGMYFDVSGTGSPLTSCELVNYLDHANVKIVWINPAIPATGGFECGWDLEGKDSYFTPFNIQFPTAAVDVGANFPAAGTYNIIAGFAEPLPTSPETVLAEIDVFFLDGTVPGQPGDSIDLTMRNADPESFPQDGLPKVLSPDYLDLFSIEMPYAPGSPSLQFNPAVCDVQFTTKTSREGVKRAFR